MYYEYLLCTYLNSLCGELGFISSSYVGLKGNVFFVMGSMVLKSYDNDFRIPLTDFEEKISIFFKHTDIDVYIRCSLCAIKSIDILMAAYLCTSDNIDTWLLSFYGCKTLIEALMVSSNFDFSNFEISFLCIM